MHVTPLVALNWAVSRLQGSATVRRTLLEPDVIAAKLTPSLSGLFVHIAVIFYLVC